MLAYGLNDLGFMVLGARVWGVGVKGLRFWGVGVRGLRFWGLGLEFWCCGLRTSSSYMEKSPLLSRDPAEMP